MEEWKEYKLGDLIVLSSGGTPNKSNSLYWGGDIPWISAKAMYDDYLYSSDMTITREGLNNGSKLAPVNSILLLTRGSGLFNRIPVCLVKREMAFNQDVKCIESINQNIVSTLFLFYWLMGNKQEISNILETTGIGAGKIDTERLKGIHIKLPPFQIQQVLIKFAESLMLKIEVNRRINDNFYFAFFEVMLIWLLTSLRNDNLEQQAQALFKSWFVDFEPFRDQPFVESELGMIPEGWRVGRYEEIIETTISGDWGKEKPEGNYIHKVACIRGCDFQDIKNGLRGNTPERYILEKNYQSKHFHHNDVLVEISGGTQTVSTGRVCLVSQLLIDKFNADIVCTNFCRVIRPIAAYAAYLYYSWLYKYNGKVMFGYENGTSGIKNFRIKDFISVEPVVIPPANFFGKFQQFVDNVQIQIQTKGSESSRLAELRDTLLPRLMSGEIKVEDVTL